MAVVFNSALIKSQPTVTTFFTSALAQGKLAHAYLFVGGNVEDKWLAARQIALYLNCTDDKRETLGSCGIREIANETRCQSCRWILEGKHPQAWFELKDPDATTIKIPVERARQISAELAKTSHYNRVIIVEDASQEIFHRPAANALLKTIEEPRGVLFFAFFARSVDQVLTTVVSRCQVVPFKQDGQALVGPIALAVQGSTDTLPRLLKDHQELIPIVQSMKNRKFFDWSKARSGKQRRLPHEMHSQGPSEKAFAVSEALEFGKVIVGLIGDEHDSDAVIDGAVLTELEIIGTRAVLEPKISGYLSNLENLADEAKMQLRGYVTKKAAIDSFLIEWVNLRSRTIA
ncbi:MAG: hypothetical protein SGJ27_02615 [Candidatus Melainabacteria bacterium]|nr:hypothetical protein [Candidatus Melainabacteria bacterium]